MPRPISGQEFACTHLYQNRTVMNPSLGMSTKVGVNWQESCYLMSQCSIGGAQLTYDSLHSSPRKACSITKGDRILFQHRIPVRRASGLLFVQELS